MVGSRTGSGKFDQIRIRPKGPDPSGSGSATLVSCGTVNFKPIGFLKFVDLFLDDIPVLLVTGTL